MITSYVSRVMIYYHWGKLPHLIRVVPCGHGPCQYQVRVFLLFWNPILQAVNEHYDSRHNFLCRSQSRQSSCGCCRGR